MQTLAFACLAIVWAAFLVPPMLRKRREGRPASSVHSFRRQLSTLERATPGTVLRPTHTSAPLDRSLVRPRTAPVRTASSAVIKRRRDVLVGLVAAAAVTFLVFVVAPGAFTFLLFAATASALGAYCYALVQIRMRAEEAAAKVRVLRPTARPGFQSTVRRTANG